jgi:hypothetical protein
VVALGDVRGPTGGIRVRRAGGRQIAVELVQVAADRVPPVAVAEHLAQPVGLAQAGGGAEDVADRDRAPEHATGSWRTGSSVRATRSSYQARICGQSVSSALAASSCRAAMAASTW